MFSNPLRMTRVARSQVANFPGENLSISCLQGDFHVNNGTTYPVQPHFYAILEEEYTPNSSGRSSEWKNFEHYKVFRGVPNLSLSSSRWYCRAWDFEPHVYYGTLSQTRSGVLGYNAGGTRQLPFGEPSMPLKDLTGVREESADGSFVPLPANLPTLIDRSLTTMLPSIKSELSIINSIIELKDFASLPNMIKQSWKLLNKRNIPLRSIFRSGSEGYLQAQFNILPLLSDIRGIYTALVRIEKRIRALVNGAGQPRKRHFTVRFEEGSQDVEFSEPMYLFRQPGDFPAAFIQYSAITLERTVNPISCTFHAEIDYNYNFSRFQTEHAQLLGLLDALGFNLNPAIIWNAIPWSFVVDWLIGISRWLDKRKTLNMEPTLNVRRYLWSIKRERIVSVRKLITNIGSSYVPSSSSPVLMPTVFETSYRRVVGIPASISPIASGLNIRELSLGAALWIAKRKRSRR